MSSTFEAELPLKMIHPHPNNPRHEAIADDEMVASIREHGIFEPVIVAPHTTKAGHYVLIAGHRRRDGATKAKLTGVPTIIRADLVTEGQQIEAMIIENGHRLDLSPIEEAEGYAQLELLGYRQAQIATAVGRNVKTIRARLGLLKLSKTTKEKVHVGQLTLEDAVTIGEYADDPEATKTLEKAAADGTLRYALNQAEQRRTALRKLAERTAVLADLGAKPYKLPDGTELWELTNTGTLGRVWNEEEWATHKGCLAYHENTTGSWPSITVLCTKPASHADAAETEEDNRRAAIAAEREAADQARAEKHAANRAAAAARTTTLLDLIGTGTKIAPAFRDLIRALLPYLLMHPECEDALKAYQEALEIPEADRWTCYWWGDKAEVNKTLAMQHLAELPQLPDGKLVRGLVGALVGMAETYLDTFDSTEKIDLQLIGSYYGLLSEAGYVNSPPDVEIQDDLREAWAKLETDDEPEVAAS